MQRLTGNHRTISPDSAVLSAYLAEIAKGSRYRKHVAMQAWHAMTPPQKLEQQRAVRSIAGSNLALGAEYTQNVLLFDHATRTV